jgi:hypothetical protein
VTDEQIRFMAERFLAWSLPEDFSPDNGISVKLPNYAPNVHWQPTGTNLFSYAQAETMVRHMIEGLPTKSPDVSTLPIVERLRAHAGSHEWFVAALTEHYNRMAEQAGSDPLPERARQSDHAPIMREAADTIEKLVEALGSYPNPGSPEYFNAAEFWPRFEEWAQKVLPLLVKIGGDV